MEMCFVLFYLYRSMKLQNFKCKFTRFTNFVFILKRCILLSNFRFQRSGSKNQYKPVYCTTKTDRYRKSIDTIGKLREFRKNSSFTAKILKSMKKSVRNMKTRTSHTNCLNFGFLPTILPNLRYNLRLETCTFIQSAFTIRLSSK